MRLTAAYLEKKKKKKKTLSTYHCKSFESVHGETRLKMW